MESAITSRNNGIGKEFKLIKELTKEKNVLITDHAWDVMDKRGISPKEVINVILTGEIIEDEKMEPCSLCGGEMEEKDLVEVIETF